MDKPLGSFENEFMSLWRFDSAPDFSQLLPKHATNIKTLLQFALKTANIIEINISTMHQGKFRVDVAFENEASQGSPTNENIHSTSISTSEFTSIRLIDRTDGKEIVWPEYRKEQKVALTYHSLSVSLVTHGTAFHPKFNITLPPISSANCRLELLLVIPADAFFDVYQLRDLFYRGLSIPWQYDDHSDTSTTDLPASLAVYGLTELEAAVNSDTSRSMALRLRVPVLNPDDPLNILVPFHLRYQLAVPSQGVPKYMDIPISMPADARLICGSQWNKVPRIDPLLGPRVLVGERLAVMNTSAMTARMPLGDLDDAFMVTAVTHGIFIIYTAVIIYFCWKSNWMDGDAEPAVIPSRRTTPRRKARKQD